MWVTACFVLQSPCSILLLPLEGVPGRQAFLHFVHLVLRNWDVLSVLEEEFHTVLKLKGPCRDDTSLSFPSQKQLESMSAISSELENNP